MGKQKMLVNVHEDETRIAMTEDGLLIGLHHQQTSRERTVGNIYKGIVVKVNPAFQAAFVDYGEKRNGFLSSSDINPAVFKGAGGGGRPRIQSVVRPGQAVMVQVLKEGMREKGAALTTFIGLPGRYLVYTPNSERSGVSRKIEDADKRHALRDILHSMLGEDDPGGVIIRTAGIDRPAADLKRDLTALKKEWKLIEERFEANKKAGLIHQEPGSIVRVLRDYFTENIEEVWVDSPEAYQEALGYFKAQLPKFQKRLRLYVGDMSIFSAHNIEEQIEALGHSRVPLRSGGGLVIEPTEAMVTIDVNSGKSNQESDIEDTALRTNLEAAQEVARQLRLRNLGGLIVVDFIDMFQQKNRAKVQQALTDALKGDKARTTVGSISQFGLLEMSRQRIDMEISVGMRTKCPYCSGTGHIPTINTSANSVLRKIRSLAATGKYQEIHGELPLELANHLLNHKRESLRDLELEFDLQIILTGNPAMQPGQAVTLSGGAAGKAGEGEAAPAPRAGANGGAAQEGEGGGRRRRGRGRGRGRGREEAEPMAATPGKADEPLEVIDVEEDHEEAFEIEDMVDEGEAPAGGMAADSGRFGEGERRPRREGRGRGERPERGERGPRGNGRAPGGGESAREVFVSTHRVTHPDVPPLPADGRRRASPFKGFAATVESGLLFDSEHPGVTDTIPLPPPSEVPAKVGRRLLPVEMTEEMISAGPRRRGETMAQDLAAEEDMEMLSDEGMGVEPEMPGEEDEVEAQEADEEMADSMMASLREETAETEPSDEDEGAGQSAEEAAAAEGQPSGDGQGERKGRRRRRRGRGGRGRSQGGAQGGGQAGGGQRPAGEEGEAQPYVAGQPVPMRPDLGNERQPQPEAVEEDEYMPGNTIEPASATRSRAPRGGGGGRRPRSGSGGSQGGSQGGQGGQGGEGRPRRRGGRGRRGRGRSGGGQPTAAVGNS